MLVVTGPFPGHPPVQNSLSWDHILSFLFFLKRGAHNCPAMAVEEGRVAKSFDCLIIRPLQVFQFFYVSNSEYVAFLTRSYFLIKLKLSTVSLLTFIFLIVQDLPVSNFCISSFHIKDSTY